jgi:hypothetical protein
MSAHRRETNVSEFSEAELEITEEAGLDALIPGPNTPRKFHFVPRHDLMLLKQVVANRPYSAPHGQTEAAWNAVTEKLACLSLRVQTRTLRDRFNLLLQKFRSHEIASLRKSGTDEE